MALRTAGLLSVKSSTFGNVRTSANGEPRVHQGWDLKAKIGTPVSLPHRCVVMGIEYNGDYGSTLIVYCGHTDNLIFFAHLSKVLVKLNSLVEPNVLLCLTGNSGNASKLPASAHHLHVEFRFKMGRYQGLLNRMDPADFLTLDENE